MLNLGDLAQYALGVPSKAEQGAIVEWLNGQIVRLDGLARRIQDGINRLKELRTALISAAVTGKIDVRGEVPNVDLDRPHPG